MDQIMWTTSNEGQMKCTSTMLSSPSVHRTPMKQNQIRCRQKGNYLSLLPNHITPPSGITKFMARNPFEADLTDRLHLSMISPTVFSKISSPGRDSPGFAWSVDEIALIQPAKIEEFPVQLTHTTDPEVEIKAQAAINRFFDENQVIPSPCELSQIDKVKPIVGTPTRPLEDLNSTKELTRTKKDCWSQTVLSLPIDLPPVVEEVLKPYLTFTQEQNIETDDVNSNNSSLRRKLFFNHDDCADNDEDSSIPLSPVKLNGEMVLPSSPPQSGIFLHGTPLKRCSAAVLCNHGTPMRNTENLSPPNVSPISSTHNMSYECLRSRSRSVMRLDFTMDVSMERSMSANSESPDNHAFQDAIDEAPASNPPDEANERAAVDCKCAAIATLSRKIDVAPRGSNLSLASDRNCVIETDCKNRRDVDKATFLTDLCKVRTSDSFISENADTQLGMSVHQSAFSSVQDTGYHTSANCTTNILGSGDSSSNEQRICWTDHVAIFSNDIRLSDWKENVKNIFSSTPSRRCKESHE